MFDRIFKELAKKYHLDERIIKEICYSPFRFVSLNMKKANMKPIKLMYIGKILPKKVCLPKLEELNKIENEFDSMNSSNPSGNTIDKN